MTKNIFITGFILLTFSLVNTANVFAVGEPCTQPRLGCAANPRGIPGVNCDGTKGATGQCLIADPDRDCTVCPSVVSPPATQPDPFTAIFGKIQPPKELKGLIGTDNTGAEGISKFLSNLIALFYSVAAIVLIFMLIWGAFDWITSEGDKEKLQSAQRKIINAIIGIMLFAITFAVIQVLGVFTGFTFFKGQSRGSYTDVKQNAEGGIISIKCLFEDKPDVPAIVQQPLSLKRPEEICREVYKTYYGK